jgi:hypothetical protein
VLPGWLPIALILLLILGGLGLIGLGLISDAGEQGTATDQGGATTTPQAKQPQAKQQQAKQQQAKPAPAPAADQQATAPPSTPPAASAGIDRRTFAGRFEVGVPSGWRTGERDGAVVLTAPGKKAEVRVFFGPQRTSLDQLAGQAAALLKQDHRGAHIGPRQNLRVGGRPAIRVNAQFQGGSASAIVLNDGSFSYLLIERFDGTVPAPIRGQAEAAIQSFRPL